MKTYKTIPHSKEGGFQFMDIREDYTYNTKLSFNEKKIDELIKTCKALIDITKEIVFKSMW